jgi:hypothetical protein
MREARPGRCARQGWADARDKAGQMREARPGRCLNQGRADVRVKAVHVREARLGRCVLQGREDARGRPGSCAGKAGQISEPRQGR